MRLSHLSSGRDNNLNLLRFMSAFAVVFSHSFPLSTGMPSAEPLMSSVGLPMGSIAVDVFFLVSGFLVAGSILRTQSLVEFTVARALRIFPGLLVMLALTVFGLGLALTSLTWREYLQSERTFHYVSKCATLFTGMAYELPGVFENNPHKRAVNGSLWTLPYEAKMYAALALTWFICAASTRLRTRAFAASCVVAMAASGAAVLSTQALGDESGKFARLFFMFFTGASYFVLREHIVLKTAAAAMLCVLLSVAVAGWEAGFIPAYLLSVPYLTFYAAFVPGGFVRKYNGVGDFSYGMYIYAFPVQQTIIALTPGISPLTLTAWSVPGTLALAVPSWFLVEKPAMRLKGRLMRRLAGGAGSGCLRQDAASAR